MYLKSTSTPTFFVSILNFTVTTEKYWEKYARKWFSRFKGHFDINDSPLSRSPSNFDPLNGLVENDSCQPIQELTNGMMDCDQSSIIRQLQFTGKVQKLGI